MLLAFRDFSGWDILRALYQNAFKHKASVNAVHNMLDCYCSIINCRMYWCLSMPYGNEL